MATTHVRNAATSVSYVIGAWVTLMVMTFLAWWFGGARGLAALGDKGIDAVILLLAFGKMFVVSHVFMEQRLAARWLRLSFTAWYAVVGGALLMFYVS